MEFYVQSRTGNKEKKTMTDNANMVKIGRVIESMDDPDIHRWWFGKHKTSGDIMADIIVPAVCEKAGHQQPPKEWPIKYGRGNPDEGIPMSTLQALKYIKLCRMYGETPVKVKVVPRGEAKALAQWFGPPRRGNPGQQYHNITTDGESQT
jgi:hypothetical protein